MMPLISLFYGGWLIGWAKPCPVTLRNFKHIRRDDILISLAGPASNLADGADRAGAAGRRSSTRAAAARSTLADGDGAPSACRDAI